MKKRISSIEKDGGSGSGGFLVAPAAPAATNVDIGDMTKEELATKLISYQQFMAKYIVEAQEQKMKAVLSAEASMKTKYEEQLKMLGAAGSTSSGSSAAEAAPIAKSGGNDVPKLYLERSAKVSAAAKAGKSRWGDMENERAQKTASGAAVVNPIVAKVNGASISGTNEKPVVAASPAPVAEVPVPPEVAAADHGLRNDGGVGGPSLAERVNLGMQLFEMNAATTAPASASSLYEIRNARIVAAGKAGKSRWGDMEIKKAANLVAASLSPGATKSSPEIEAADHGLRADGGVGGPTLAERVNLGASLVGR